MEPPVHFDKSSGHMKAKFAYDFRHVLYVYIHKVQLIKFKINVGILSSGIHASPKVLSTPIFFYIVTYKCLNKYNYEFIFEVITVCNT